MKFFINVRRIGFFPENEDDAGIEGVYEVDVTLDESAYSEAQLASAALDIFHTHIAIRVLEHFEILVINENHEIVEEDDSHDSYSLSDAGSVEKINDEIYTDFSSDIGLSSDDLDHKYNFDGDGQHPFYKRDDWRAQVAHQQTISGYWEWVAYLLTSKTVNTLIRPFEPTTSEPGKEYFPGATIEEIGSVMLQDIVGDYDTPDQVPEWAWIEAQACFVHKHNGKDGVWDFVLNLSLDLSSAPATLLPFLTEAKQKQLAYVIFHQGT